MSPSGGWRVSALLGLGGIYFSAPFPFHIITVCLMLMTERQCVSDFKAETVLIETTSPFSQRSRANLGRCADNYTQARGTKQGSYEM